MIAVAAVSDCEHGGTAVLAVEAAVLGFLAHFACPRGLGMSLLHGTLSAEGNPIPSFPSRVGKG